ncbi:MAG TPA: RsmE family RNA methyltransferase [Polyangiaceae bacterium]
MRSVRVAVTDLSPGERRLDADAAHYLAHVHRLREGEAFLAFDPEARLEAEGVILEVARDAVSVRLSAPTAARAVPTFDVTLVQCAGKGEKTDDVVRATVALGVGTVIVAESARSVARLDAERAEKRRERWRAVALDAARQSGRGDAPSIEGPRPLDDVLAVLGAGTAVKLCLDPHATMSFSEAVRREAPAKSFVLVVGPEGGLSDEELVLAERMGFVRARLGPFVLRTELAATAALAALLVLASD